MRSGLKITLYIFLGSGESCDQSTVFQYFLRLLIIGTVTSCSQESAHVSQKQLAAGMPRINRPRKREVPHPTPVVFQNRTRCAAIEALRRGPSARSWAHQARYACAPRAIRAMHVHVASSQRLSVNIFSLAATKESSSTVKSSSTSGACGEATNARVSFGRTPAIP